MAEPLPPQPTPEAPKPQTVTIGETPLYMTEPVIIDGQSITSFTILGKDQRAGSGAGSAVILTKEPSRKKENRGELVEKENLNMDRMDVKNWSEISGIRLRDEAGNSIDIPKEKLALEQPQKPVAAENLGISDVSHLSNLGEKPNARKILEGLQESPNTITIVGLKAYETRALTLADRSMQKLMTENKSGLAKIHDFVFTGIWKQSIGGIYFHEKSRQYYLDMLKASETPFAEEAIRLAERRATDVYNKKIADSNFLVRAGTKAVDWLKDKVGMRTTIQTLALEEIGRMKAAGEIQGMETLDRETKAIRLRFGQDFDKADQFVRKQLGEKLEILDPARAEHQPLVEGIQALLKQYASGEIPDKAEFDKRSQELFTSTLKNVRPDIFAEAELYSSSLFDAAETLRAKADHLGGIENINDAMAGIEIRLGLGQMGEVTSLEPTAVEKGLGKVREVVEWLNRKHVIVPLVLNEATIGSGIALALSAVKFFQTMPARLLAPAGGVLAGGAFAGWREYGQLHKDYLTHLRERESGATFTEMQKKRQWFERFAPKQRGAGEMIATIQTAMDTGDYRSAMATIADLQARKAVSETGPKRIGLIQYSSRDAIESERTALDILAGKTLGDLASRDDLGDLLGGNDFPQFMEKLTVMQTRVLREGVGVLTTMEDPVNATLNLVSQYAPEANLLKRRWPFSAGTEVKAAGMDAIMEEFKKEARLEAVKYGVKAGAIGAAIGAAFQGIEALGHAAETVKSNIATEASTVTHAELAKAEVEGARVISVPMTLDVSSGNYHETPPIDGMTYLTPKELIVSLDGTKFDAIIQAENTSITIGDNLSKDELFAKFKEIGFDVQDGHVATAEGLTQAVRIEDLPQMEGNDITAHLPPGFSLEHFTQPGHAEWALVNDKQETIVRGLHFNADGTLSNYDDVKEKLSSAGLSLDTHTRIIETQVTAAPIGTPIIPETPNVSEFTNDMTIEGKDMGDGGIWDYFLGKTHNVTDANGMKNIFRLYTHDQDNANITFDDTSTHKDYIAEHLRTAQYGGEEVQEFDLARIPNDAHIGLDSRIFGENGIDKFHDLNIAAQDRMNALVTEGANDIKGPMHAIKFMETGSDQDKLYATVLRLGYVGQDDKLPSKESVDALMAHMAGMSTGESSGAEAAKVVAKEASESVPKTISLQEIVITAKPTEATPGTIVSTTDPLPMTIHEVPAPTETVAAAQTVQEMQYEHVLRENLPTEAPRSEFPWIPIFLPYRSVLEAPMAEIAESGEAGKTKRDTVLSPFGMEGTYLDRAALDERKSPRLKEKPSATLHQQEEINWYLSALTPEEQEAITKLSQDLPPMSPEVRAAIVIPLSQIHGGNAYQRLSAYTTQTNADGTLLDPKKVEYVVYDTLGQKEDVDKFITEHPDLRVVYVNPGYSQEQPGGKIKRDATNLVMSRITTLPVDSPDVVITIDRGQTTTIEPTYVSAMIEAFDTNPTLDAAGGSYTMPAEAYANFPMLFASQRAFEIFDGLVRHGENSNIPATYIGNLATRSGTLAAIGGYDGNANIGEDQQLSWMIATARANPDAVATLPAMTATFEPKELTYAMLQSAGLADKDVALSQNETYKDMPWQDMAKRMNDVITKEQLEAQLSSMHQSYYPALRERHPERFDAYFKRTLDTLGLQYELTDGKVTITNTDQLATNMAAPVELETFAKVAAAEVVAATPKEPETPRENLENLAGEIPTVPVETPTETAASTISSPDLSHLGNVNDLEKQTPETLPTGIEDRMNYVLEKSKESQAAVQLTPGELMDYIKSSVDIAGTRITEGNIVIDGNAVKLTDMKADIRYNKAHIGDGSFSATLITDPQKGLVVDHKSLNMKLPFMLKMVGGTKILRESLDNFNGLVTDHINTRIDPNWKAERIDIVGEKLQVKFAKKIQ